MNSMWWLVSSSFSNSTGCMRSVTDAGAGSRDSTSSVFLDESSADCWGGCGGGEWQGNTTQKRGTLYKCKTTHPQGVDVGEEWMLDLTGLLRTSLMYPNHVSLTFSWVWC